MDRAFEIALDVDFYRQLHADLSHMNAGEARDHFYRYGIGEGRQAATLGSRRALVDHITTLDSVLEIGPFCNPIICGPNVRYLDMFTAEQLRANAERLGLDTSRCPEQIDYVGDISMVDRLFDAVVSSHSIEHQTDLVHHFNGIAKVLKPGTGRYYLIIPDKRYCFDHFLPESTIADVLQAHSEARRRHTLKSVIDHRAFTTHNDPWAHWAGEHGDRYRADLLENVQSSIALVDSSNANGSYVDVHAWFFTPDSFLRMMNTLFDCGLTPLKAVEVHATLRNQFEFCAVLENS